MDPDLGGPMDPDTQHRLRTEEDGDVSKIAWDLWSDGWMQNIPGARGEAVPRQARTARSADTSHGSREEKKLSILNIHQQKQQTADKPCTNIPSSQRPVARIPAGGGSLPPQQA
jgi:hypothetical protein